MKHRSRFARGVRLLLLFLLPLGACVWQDDCGEWHCIGPVFPCIGEVPAPPRPLDPPPDPTGPCESESFRPRARAGGIA